MKKLLGAALTVLFLGIAAGCGSDDTQTCTCTCTCGDGTQPPISGAESASECEASCKSECDALGTSYANRWQCTS